MYKFFDKLEDHVRGHLSRYPITYSIIGGVGVVLFWRGIWGLADTLATMHPILSFFFSFPVQAIFSTLLLLITGLMVSVFIGDRIILSGLRHERKLEEMTEELVEQEVITLAHIRDEIRDLKTEVQTLKHK